MIPKEQLKKWTIVIGMGYAITFIFCVITDALTGTPLLNAFGQAAVGITIVTLLVLAIKKDWQQEQAHKELLKIPDKKK